LLASLEKNAAVAVQVLNLSSPSIGVGPFEWQQQFFKPGMLESDWRQQDTWLLPGRLK